MIHSQLQRQNKMADAVSHSQAAVGALHITSRETVAPRCGTGKEYCIKRAFTVQFTIRNDIVDYNDAIRCIFTHWAVQP